MKIRKVEVLVGPLTDIENTSTSEALKIESTGLNTELSIAFVVKKTIASSLNQSDLIIENLNRETEALFNQENLNIQIRAGYIDPSTGDSETGILLIHNGGVKIVDPTGNSTRITSVDGGGNTFVAVSNRSYSGGESLEMVVRDLVSDIPNIAIGRLSLTGNIGFKGRHLSGGTSGRLNELADQLGFTWSIQDGVFQAFMDTATTDQVFEFTDNNIIAINPIGSGKADGYRLKTFLDARVNPGDLIKVSSTSRPEYNGTYRVDVHEMAGGSHSKEWVSRFDLGV